MKSLILALMTITMIGCTSKECKPSVEFVEKKFPLLETVDVNRTIEIPTYFIKREDISVFDGNVSMKIETFKKIKDGDRLKVDYLRNRLKIFMFGLDVMNRQARKFNEEFSNGNK